MNEKVYKGFSRKNLPPFSNCIKIAYLTADCLYFLDDVEQIFNYYMSAYKDFTGQNHNQLSINTLKELIYSLPFCTDMNGVGIDLEPDDYPILIDKHFKTNYGSGCDYSMPHFMSGVIRANRYFEELY